jgi:hypothetical protein
VGSDTCVVEVVGTLRMVLPTDPPRDIRELVTDELACPHCEHDSPLAVRSALVPSPVDIPDPT